MGQFEDLRLFALIVETGSISKAAQKMHIAKSAVSRRLNLLEERYSSRLIDRMPGVWKVTATGLELYQRAVNIVSEVDEIEGDFNASNQNLTGPLTLSVPRDFGFGFLKPVLIAFKEKYPDIQLMVDFDDRKVDLSRENYDFAIRITSQSEANIIAHELGKINFIFCASPNYLAIMGEPETVKALNRHKLLYFGTARRAMWEVINEFGKCERIEFQPTLNSNSGEFLMQAAQQDLGITLLPDFICSDALKQGSLRALLRTKTMPEAGIYLVHAQERRLNRRMRLFADEIKTACSLDPIIK